MHVSLVSQAHEEAMSLPQLLCGRFFVIGASKFGEAVAALEDPAVAGGDPDENTANRRMFISFTQP